jgi:hypothetical protein
MSWSTRRRNSIIAIFVLGVFLVVVVFLFFHFNQEPTCFDGIANGDEEGIDCGGNCQQVCGFQAVDPVVLWSRMFEVQPGIYSAIAYIENPNISFAAKSVPYTFKMFDERNILVQERDGIIDLPPKMVVPVFEGTIITGERKPQRVFFELMSSVNWLKNESGILVGVSVTQGSLENTQSNPRLKVAVNNSLFEDVFDLEVVATVFDIDGNAVGASRTVIERIMPRSFEEVYFTWPNPFETTPVRSEVIVIPRVF